MCAYLYVSKLCIFSSLFWVLRSPIFMAVISPQFCVGTPLTLTVIPRVWASDEVVDVNGRIVFKIKAKPLSLRAQHTLLDAGGNPIVTFNRKLSSSRGRWRVYRGESTDDRDLIFTVLDPTFCQTNKKRNVYLAGNAAENYSDFKIKTQWFHGTYAVYASDSYDTKIAQTRKLLLSRRYEVTVNPDVDYAFVVTLVFIIAEVDKQLEEERRRG